VERASGAVQRVYDQLIANYFKLVKMEVVLELPIGCHHMDGLRHPDLLYHVVRKVGHLVGAEAVLPPLRAHGRLVRTVLGSLLVESALQEERTAKDPILPALGLFSLDKPLPSTRGQAISADEQAGSGYFMSKVIHSCKSAQELLTSPYVGGYT